MYDTLKIAADIIDIARGKYYQGNALYVAKSISGVTDKERSTLDTAMTSELTLDVRVKLLNLAYRLLNTEPPKELELDYTFLKVTELEEAADNADYSLNTKGGLITSRYGTYEVYGHERGAREERIGAGKTPEEAIAFATGYLTAHSKLINNEEEN